MKWIIVLIAVLLATRMAVATRMELSTITIKDGSIMTGATGVILKASDGPKCFKVSVNNQGKLLTEETGCQ